METRLFVLENRIDELGRFVWHSAAHGGSGIEVDEEGHS